MNLFYYPGLSLSRNSGVVYGLGGVTFSPIHAKNALKKIVHAPAHDDFALTNASRALTFVKLKGTNAKLKGTDAVRNGTNETHKDTPDKNGDTNDGD